MAKMWVTGIDDAINNLENMEENVDEIFLDAVRAGAGVIAGEVCKRLEQNLNSPRSASPTGGKFDRKREESTGDLLDSFGISPARRDENGNYDTKIGFGGYDRKGVANALKARVMESGSSKVKKRPFFRPGVRAARKRALTVSRDIIISGLLKKKG